MTRTSLRSLESLSLGVALIAAVQQAQPAVPIDGPDCCQLSSGCFPFDATQGTCPGETTTNASCVAGVCLPSTPGACGDGVVDPAAGEECDPPGSLCEPPEPGRPPLLACVANCTCLLDVFVDIRPGSDGNPVNPDSNGVIPVALLGSDVVDAVDVDVKTLAFGPALAPVDAAAGSRLGDVNHDGLLDVLSHYRTPETGILPGETEACLTGTLLDGTPFEGCDAVQTVSNGESDPEAMGASTVYECGGHVVYENRNPYALFSITVSLRDNCFQSGEPSDSQIVCRSDVSDPDSEYDAISVPDGAERTFRCEDIPGPPLLTPVPPPGEKEGRRPSGGGVFIFCNGLGGDCIVKKSRPKPSLPGNT